MAVISYDETSGFEKKEMKNTSMPMVAGFIYHGDDAETERERIEEFLIRICNKAGVKYPDDLHFKKDNGKDVAGAKECYCERMINFIRWGRFGKGVKMVPQAVLADDNNKEIERKGYYQLAVVYHDPAGSKREAEDAGNIFSTLNAANLYVKMAEKFVLKSGFINPFMKENERLDFILPTRIYKLKKPKKDSGEYVTENKRYEEERNKFISAGYKHVSIPGAGGNYEQYWEIIENTGMQAILKKFIDSYRDPGFSNYDFFMDSPEYRLQGDRLYDGKHVFMFLSDCICTYIEHQIKYLRKEKKDERPNGLLIQDIINELNGRKDNLFFYDGDIDDSFDMAMGEAHKGNVFEALGRVYDAKKKNEGEIADYYAGKWFLEAEKSARNAKPRDVEAAVRELDRYRLSNAVDQEKLLYIHKCLMRTHKAALRSMDRRALYTLYDIGISAYVHTGNPAKAIGQYELCKTVEIGIDRGEVNKTMNRMVTCYIDEFRFRDAEEVSMELLGIKPAEGAATPKNIGEVLSKIFGRKTPEKSAGEKVGRPATSPDVYKPLSSLAQAYAFQKDARAEECFLKVVRDNEEQRNFDYFITLSYLLHWYIESGEKEKYEEYADRYFEEKSLDRKLANLVRKKESGDRSFGFALFIYIKAFYRFYAEDGKNKKILLKLADLGELFGGGETFAGHPWEIIYKYSRLLCTFLPEGEHRTVLSEKNERDMQLALGKSSGRLLKQIVAFGQIEVLDREGRTEERDKKIRALCKLLFKETLESNETNYDNRMNELSQKFTYMYH